MNFRLAISFILLAAEFFTSNIFYSLDPLGPVCSRFATKWSYINEHFVVAAVAWGIITIGVSFFTPPGYWFFLQRTAAMKVPMFIVGAIGLLIDIGGSAYQRWVVTIDMSIHSWTRWGLIVNAGLRTLLWLVIYSAISVLFYIWAARREADIIDD